MFGLDVQSQLAERVLICVAKGYVKYVTLRARAASDEAKARHHGADPTCNNDDPSTYPSASRLHEELQVLTYRRKVYAMRCFEISRYHLMSEGAHIFGGPTMPQSIFIFFILNRLLLSIRPKLCVYLSSRSRKECIASPMVERGLVL
jgi:hypothetical protein